MHLMCCEGQCFFELVRIFHVVGQNHLIDPQRTFFFQHDVSHPILVVYVSIVALGILKWNGGGTCRNDPESWESQSRTHRDQCHGMWYLELVSSKGFRSISNVGSFQLC